MTPPRDPGEVDVGASMPTVACPAPDCGPACKVCEGRGRAYRFMAARYRCSIAGPTRGRAA